MIISTFFENGVYDKNALLAKYMIVFLLMEVVYGQSQ